MAPHTVPCPSCRRPSPWQGNPHRPFCSARCRMADLGSWVSEQYRIPGAPLDAIEPPDQEDDEPR